MNVKMENVMTESNSFGSIIVSIILGLGLSSLFKKVCKQNCIVYKISNYQDIKNQVFEHEDKCYMFDKVKSGCGPRLELIKEEQKIINR